MAYDEHGSRAPLPGSDELLEGFLRDGLRPVEIAVRLGVPVVDVRSRIDRLAGNRAGQPAAEPVSPPGAAPTSGERNALPARDGSRVPRAALGAVIALFVAAVTIFIVSSGDGGEGAERAAPAPILPVVITPAPPIQVNGVALDAVTLGAPVALSEHVALLVVLGCQDCDTSLAWYVQGLNGVDTLPVNVPEGARQFSAAVSRDGGDIILTAREGDEWSVFRSRDGGARWVELWRGPEAVHPAFAGPEYVVVLTNGVPPENAIIVPGGVPVILDGGATPALTPWRVDFQIREREGPRGDDFLGSVNEDGSRSFGLVESAPSRRGNVVGLYDGEGKLMKGWFNSPAMPWGALLGDQAYVAAVVGLGGEFVLHDEDEGSYPGEYRMVPAVFDTSTGAVHRLELGLPVGTNALVLTAVRGPFARVDRALQEECLPIVGTWTEPGDRVGCLAPGRLLVDLGESGEGTDGTVWLKVRVPGGLEGWAPAAGVERSSPR